MKIYDAFKPYFLILCMTAVLFGGCAAKFKDPNLSKFDSKIFEITTSNGLSILYVSHADENYNFTLVNALGAPLARRVLKPNGEFESIGFLPPNRSYNELFIKILDMIKLGKIKAEILLNDEKIEVRRVDIHK